jgi:acylphosphatase
MLESKRFLVSGLVQGVGFRYFVLRRAIERGLRGSVRNLPDGRVEVLAQGTEEALERFRSEIEIGSRHSKVQRVEEAALAAQGEFAEFTIID